MQIKVMTLDIDHRLMPSVCADVAALPFADKTFDTVLAAESFGAYSVCRSF